MAFLWALPEQAASEVIVNDTAWLILGVFYGVLMTSIIVIMTGMAGGGSKS
jgi:hypothetical protein